MATPQFSFGFAGDDIDENDNMIVRDVPGANSATRFDSDGSVDVDVGIGVKSWDINELLINLPSRISYYTTEIVNPEDQSRVVVPRRALFDVRMQIMAESESTIESGEAEIGLGDSDIKQNVYEGGFKSWEGAMDLAKFAFKNTVGGGREFEGVNSVIELGCGTALPSLVLYSEALRSPASALDSLVLADYNSSVLRLVTIPNLFLTWASLHEGASSAFDPHPFQGSGMVEGEFHVTSQLKAAFLAEVQASRVELTIISGPWSVDLLHEIPCQPRANILVLAAETVYSPASTVSFTNLLLGILERSGAGRGQGIIAAKRIYFGVGGNVNDFIQQATTGGAVVEEVMGSCIDEGVGRCLLKVVLAS